jgi:hypothetical protein
MMAQSEFIRREMEDAAHDEAGKPNGEAPWGAPSFTLVRFRDIKLGKEPGYLIKGLIPREGLAVIWGPSKCGKTFWVFDLMMHVALGWLYRGRAVEAGTVVYIACEGERGLAARKEAFRTARLALEDPPFYLLTTRLDLQGQIDTLVADIAAQIPDGPCAAIVLDTLNRSIRGSESKDEDMSAYIAAADVLRDRFKCAVVIIHHCGVNDARPRGHTSLTGAVDAQIAVKRNPAGQIVCVLEWMKDGPEGAEIFSLLKVVNLGEDDTGEEVSSCVVEPVAEADAERATKKAPKLSPAQGRALQLLADAVSTNGEVPPACNHIPSNARCVTESLWREYCYSGAISAGDQDAKQKAFKRAAEALVDAGRVGKWAGWVWPAFPGQNGQTPGQNGHARRA